MALWTERIVRVPDICGGMPTFRGTRVTLRVVLNDLAAGTKPEVILHEYPSLKPEDVDAAIAFAAASAAEDLPLSNLSELL